MRNSAHGKGHEERGLAYAKVWSSLRKPPVPEHLTPKPECIYFTVSCSRLHLWLYGGLFPTGSLGGVNVSSKSIKIPGRDKSVSAYELLWRLSSPPVGLSGHRWLFTASQSERHVLDLLKANYFGELEIISIVCLLGIILVKGSPFVVSIIAANSLLWVGQGGFLSNFSADRLACVTGLSILLPLGTSLFTTSQL